MTVPSPPHLLLLAFALLPLAASTDTLPVNQPMRTNQSIVSAAGAFKLGFFSPGDPKDQYLAIWYNNIKNQTAIWVANREFALPVSSGGSLVLSADGSLVLANDTGGIYWSSTKGEIGVAVSRPVAKLLDSGNLIVQDGSGRVVWQSFDYPSDSILPGMKLGWNLRTGLDRVFTSWVSSTNPAPGPYKLSYNIHGVPEVFLYSNTKNIWRSGPWNGERFSGIPDMRSYDMLWFEYESNANEVYYSFHAKGDNILSRLFMSPDGTLQRQVWVSSINDWNAIWYAPKDQCDFVSPCGPFGVCDSNAAPICSCLQGFTPKSPEEWNLRDGTSGCVRETALDCRNGTDGFVTISGAKLPDTTNATVNYGMSLSDCQSACFRNCSCTAYAVANISSSIGGCIMWLAELTDLRVYTVGGQDLYVRLAAKDLGSRPSSKNKTRLWILIAIFAFVGIILILLAGWGCFLLKKMKTTKTKDIESSSRVISLNKYLTADGSIREMELPLFEFSSIALATNNFSNENKLGEGGFGPVYKGKLEDGQEVAIKRLARHSVQGTDEFKNEVELIAKLQHRNLVRLLGCCIDGEERLLVYEFMPNGSLDGHLFEKDKGSMLDWESRYGIITGIARGLLYLHEDSRLRIIHRDLKAGNILLDAEMTPKISDFGMARIFIGGDMEVNTTRVAGTYGYMSPEYAMDGVFSVKSDVFSFGVLVLEIVSGKRNRGFFLAENLLGHTWTLWKEGNSLEVVDKSIKQSFPPNEVLKCINIGLLCVQERAEDRPTMSSVVLMLGSDNASLPQPQQPGFAMMRGSMTNSTSSKQESSSVNAAPLVSSFEGR